MRPLVTPLLLTSLLIASPATTAQDTQVLPAVRTELKRDGAVLPYAQLNQLLSKLRQHGEGLFRMDFRVIPEKTKKPLAELRMAVRSDEADHPIKLDAEGRFDLPLLPDAEAKTADLATNAAKGELAVNGTVKLTTLPEQLDLATVRRIMQVGRKLREELLPFYLRWLFPRGQGVRICSDAPTWELTWTENGQLLGLPLQPATGEREPETKKGEASRPCTVLTGQENWPDAARLVPPPGTKLSIKL